MNVSANQETLCRDWALQASAAEPSLWWVLCVDSPPHIKSVVWEKTAKQRQHAARSRKAEAIPYTSFINQRTVAFQNCKLLARAEP